MLKILILQYIHWISIKYHQLLALAKTFIPTLYYIKFIIILNACRSPEQRDSNFCQNSRSQTNILLAKLFQLWSGF